MLEDKHHSKTFFMGCRKCQENKRKREEMSSLSTTLLDSAKNEIQKSIIADLEQRVKRAEQECVTNRARVRDYSRYIDDYTKSKKSAELAQKTLDEKLSQTKETLAVLLSAFGEGTTAKAGPFQRYVGYMFHLDSKSGGKGHFLEVDTNGQLKCSCTAATFDNDCWAKKVVANELNAGNPDAWRFLYSRRNFDARVRPVSLYFRVPGYTSRTFNRYSTLR